jgi:hypothetical protein
MTSVRALAHTHCPNCNETTLHSARVCQRCHEPNNSSGQAPVPRPRPYGYATIKAKHYTARAEQGAARRRARAARAQQLSMRGQM